MPLLTINTNLAKSQVPKNFAMETVKIVASLLGKPVEYVVVHVLPEQIMSWGGTDEPCATACLSSIGAISAEANEKTSAGLFNHFEKRLKLPGDRVYLFFNDSPKENVGYNGTTFAQILK